jgi:hypothetical protein
MKNLFTLLLFSFSVLSLQAVEIKNITMTGGGPNGYASTVKSKITVDAPGLWGYMVSYTQIDILCEGAGYDQCPTMANSNEIVGVDQIDANYSNLLVEHAEVALSNNEFSGDYAISVQVEGEATARQYRVVWTSDSLDTNIKVYRDDI